MASDDSKKGVLNTELFARIRHLQIRTKHLVTEALAGDYESAFKGFGMEFEEVREYLPGDDVRHIDWKVTARMDAPYIKVHKQERELTVMLLVDVSASGSFGSGDRFKREVAAEAAAILAYTAIKSNDRVGLLLFSDKVELYIPAKKGSAHVWRVISEILSFEPEGHATDIKCALDLLGKVARKRAVVFVVSDFIDQGYQDALNVAARRHDLTGLVVSDPREVDLPNVGMMMVRDAESGNELLLDTGSLAVRRAYKEMELTRRALLKEQFLLSGVDLIELDTTCSVLDPIVAYMRGRRSGR